MAEELESIGEMKEKVQNDEDLASASRQDSETSKMPASVERMFSAEFEKRIGERIAEEVERRFQSAKDKRWARLERQFGALKEFKEAFDGEKSDAVGRNAATYDDDWLAKKTREFVEAAGLSNDAEMKALLQEGEYSPDVEGYVDMLGDITELALRRAGRRRGQPATVVQPTGGGAPQPDLRNQYDQRKSKLRPGDINGLLDLKREFRKKGLEIF